MKTLIALAFGALLIGDEKPQVGKVVADVAMKTIDGKDVKLSDSRANAEKKVEGEITVIYSWSFKCPSGAPNLPKVKDFAEKVAGKDSGVRLLCVSSYGETA